MTAQYANAPIKLVLIILLLLAGVGGCSTPAPLWHTEAGQIVQSVRAAGAREMLPSEYASLTATFDRGEILLLGEQVDEADLMFRMVILKGELLRANLDAEKARRAEQERVRRIEQEQREKERLAALEREKEQRRREAEAVRARIAEQARLEAEAEARRQAERLRLQRERIQLVTSHTVKRGETLPLIAALPEVYNDALLWPLIYRANRDQIRNPKNLWPGQTLRLPRNVSREDVNEARRYAHDKRQP